MAVGGDKKEHGLRNDQYLNRLQEFCRQTFGSGIAADLLRAELDALTVVIRKVDKIGSKGVHADVTRADAHQGLLGLYLFFSNLITRLEAMPAMEAEGKDDLTVG